MIIRVLSVNDCRTDNFKSLLFTDLSTTVHCTVIRLSFRDKIAWLFESELPEEKAKRAKTEATQGDGSSGGSSSSSSSSSSSRSYSRFRYHGRQSDKEKGADSTIPQLLENYYSTYDTYFETKGILKLLMAEYLRTHNVRLKKERSRNRFIPNGRSYSKYGRGVAGAARLIKALGDDYGRYLCACIFHEVLCSVLSSCRGCNCSCWSHSINAILL